MSVEMETGWSPSPSVVTVGSDMEEMDEVWVEEVILEEDGSPAEAKWNVDDVLTLSPSGGVKSLDESASPGDPTSPPGDTRVYILPDSLTQEEDCLLEESFELMEDLIRFNTDSELEWKETDERSVVEKAQELLDHLDEIKQEPFSDWLEEKTELPLLEELGGLVGYQQRPTGLPEGAVPFQPRPAYVPTPHVGQIAPQFTSPGFGLLSAAVQPDLSDLSAHVPEVSDDGQTSLVQQPPLTPALIREFETVLHQTLTPPTSPPTYVNFPGNQEEEKKAKELAEEELDALINSQVASLYEEKSQDEDWSSRTSRNSEWGSASTSPTTEDSDSACLSSSESDPDWAPSDSAIPTRCGASKNRRAVSSTEERKLRKKEQNKNAATRYRIKKKAEQAGIVGEESVLLEKNTLLKEKATELQREIKYLKSLMKDICKAKGLIQ